MTETKTPAVHSSKFVMTFAEYCQYQRWREKATRPARFKRLGFILQHAEIINPITINIKP